MNRRGFLSLFAAAPVAVPALAVDALANPPPVTVAKTYGDIFPVGPRPVIQVCDLRDWGGAIERALTERGIIEIAKPNE